MAVLLLSTLGLLVVAQYLVQQLIVFPSFVALEEHDASQNLDRAVLALDRELEHLDVVCHDWGSWDETAAYMVEPDEEFIRESMSASVLAGAELSLIQLIKPDGRIPWQLAIDATGKAVPVVGLPTKKYPANHLLVRHPQSKLPLAQRSIAGVLVLGEVPYLIASRPVLTSENQGPIRGTLVLGRRLSPAYVASLAKQTRVGFEVLLPGTAEGNRTFAAIDAATERGEGMLLERLGGDRLRVARGYPSLEGGTAFAVTTVLPRPIVAQGMASMRAAVLLNLLAGLLTLLGAVLGMRGLLLKPISELTGFASGIATSGDTSTRLTTTRRDELGTLARAFDSMLERLGRQAAELATVNAELEVLAIQDGLTKLANRRRFDAALDTEWRRMTRNNTPLALILCDVDFFKRYNDTYGHSTGDACLIAVAGVLGSGVHRAGDVAARYGGEEFAVLLPETDLAGALHVAESLRAGVERLAIEHSASNVAPHVTASFGVAVAVPERGEEPKHLIEAADAALYTAKEGGRNRVATRRPASREPATTPLRPAANG